jgi:hypothetical protein
VPSIDLGVSQPATHAALGQRHVAAERLRLDRFSSQEDTIGARIPLSQMSVETGQRHFPSGLVFERE